MDRELLFGKTLEAVRKKAKEQGNVIAKEDVELAFAELDLSEDQLALVYEYLKKHKIGIGEPVDLDDYLEKEDIDYLALYLEELQALPQLSEGQREAVTLSAMAGDIAAKKQLISLHLPDVVDVAKLYAGQGVMIEDLIGEGNVALTMGVEMLGALERPDEVQGMLGKLMMDAMEDYIAEQTDVKEQERKVADRVNRVADAAKELSEELLKKVTVEELAGESGLSEEEIRDAVRISGQKIEEIEDPTQS